MKHIDLDYIKRFLEEVEALYGADDGDHYPEYLKEMILNIRFILEQERAEDR